MKGDTIFYGTIFQKDHLDKVHAGRKAGSPENDINTILEDAEENETKLKSMDESTRNSDEFPASLKSNSTEKNELKLKFLGKDGAAYHKYDGLFGRHLNTLSHIEFNFKNMKKNQEEVSSAKKRLKDVFHQYARSVTKSAMTPNKGFFFTEEISLENLDPESKREIIFGEKVTDFFDVNPPGIDPPVLMANTRATPTQRREAAQAERSPINSEKKKPVVLSNSKNRYTGTFKFFKDDKNYGFLVMDRDNRDIFVYLEDLSQAGLTREQLNNVKYMKSLKFSFCELKYIGKNGKKSKKAVDIKIKKQL